MFAMEIVTLLVSRMKDRFRPHITTGMILIINSIIHVILQLMLDNPNWFPFDEWVTVVIIKLHESITRISRFGGINYNLQYMY